MDGVAVYLAVAISVVCCGLLGLLPSLLQRQEPRGKRAVALISLVGAIGASVFIAVNTHHGQKRQEALTRAATEFTLWRDHFGPVRDRMIGQWAVVKQQLSAVTAFAPADTVSDDSITRYATEIELLLANLTLMFNAHALVVQACEQGGAIDFTNTRDVLSARETELRDAREAKDFALLRRKTTQVFVDLPELCYRCESVILSPMDAFLMAESSRFRADPVAWKPRISEADLRGLLPGTTGASHLGN